MFPEKIRAEKVTFSRENWILSFSCYGIITRVKIVLCSVHEKSDKYRFILLDIAYVSDNINFFQLLICQALPGIFAITHRSSDNSLTATVYLVFPAFGNDFFSVKIGFFLFVKKLGNLLTKFARIFFQCIFLASSSVVFKFIFSHQIISVFNTNYDRIKLEIF